MNDLFSAEQEAAEPAGRFPAMHELLTTRSAGCDSAATCLSGNIFTVITESSVISGGGAGGNKMKMLRFHYDSAS